jgi:hypothetical protein
MVGQAGPAGDTILIRPLLASTTPRDLPRAVEVLGSGRAVRALLTVAALQGSTCHFRISCRHQSRAEFLRVHLADLPPLSVEIVVADMALPESRRPVVLALGQRTSRRSRQKSKDALFGENLAIISGLVPQLVGRSVIVVTNPSTRLTAQLRASGVAALGIGVMNDQLRFERDAGQALRLVGAHNPFELGFGALGGPAPDPPLSFSRAAYRDLTNRQDRQRPLLDPDGVLMRLTPALHERAWRDLGQLHDGLDVAKRWYARQRLASRYLENGIACGRAILTAIDFLTGQAIPRPDLTLEAPVRIGERTLVVGWPWDSFTGEPRALSLDPASLAVVTGLATPDRLGLAQASASADAIPAARPAITLRRDGVPSIRCSGAGLDELWPDLVPLSYPDDAPGGTASIDVRLVDDPEALPDAWAVSTGAVQQIAQHRGKNVFEHRDLTIRALPGQRRLIAFGSGARALIDDDSRQITLAAPHGTIRRDEFRKLLRDQILTPAYAAAGAWVLHAGLVSLGGAGLLLLGDSGAGKTTAALHLLGGDGNPLPEGGYGASERVLVFMRGGQLMALGVPESLTIFRGTLRGLRRFADLVAGHDPAQDWSRSHKLRLSRDEVVSRLGSHQIARPIPVSHVALLRYRATLKAAVSSPITNPAFRRETLTANDLTTEDDVRAAWLGWFPAQRDPAVPDTFAGGGLPFAVIDWPEPGGLAHLLARHCAAH